LPTINFQYPQALWLLAAVPLVLLAFAIHVVRRRRAVRQMGDPVLVKNLLRNISFGRQALKFALALLAYILGVLALANPRQPEQATIDVRKGIDVVLALDISNSMLALEGGTTRLQAAHNLMNSLVQRLTDDRIGLVLFAGNAYVQMPLTFDRGAANLFISTASPTAIKEQGTAITDALQKASSSFDPESERFQTIVLLTDGETHDEGALEKATELAEAGVVINTVGIGSAGGTTLMDTATGTARRDATGNVIISRLNETLLQELAAATKGQYLHLLGNTDAVATALAGRFRQMEQKGIGDTSQVSYKTLYLWAAVPMALLLLLEFFIPTRKKVKA
jgi:Ca-activated chloride channel family protein